MSLVSVSHPLVWPSLANTAGPGICPHQHARHNVITREILFKTSSSLLNFHVFRGCLALNHNILLFYIPVSPGILSLSRKKAAPRAAVMTVYTDILCRRTGAAAAATSLVYLSLSINLSTVSGVQLSNIYVLNNRCMGFRICIVLCHNLLTLLCFFPFVLT